MCRHADSASEGADANHECLLTGYAPGVQKIVFWYLTQIADEMCMPPLKVVARKITFHLVLQHLWQQLPQSTKHVRTCKTSTFHKIQDRLPTRGRGIALKTSFNTTKSRSLSSQALKYIFRTRATNPWQRPDTRSGTRRCTAAPPRRRSMRLVVHRSFLRRKKTLHPWGVG